MSPLQVCIPLFSCIYLFMFKKMILKLFSLHNKNSWSSLPLVDSSFHGMRWPVGRRRISFWPRRRATSTSTLSLRGHWSCRQTHMLIWTHQQSLRCRGLHICCGTTVGRGSMPLVFIHSHLLDFDQPKTIYIFCFENLLYRICFWFVFVFSEMYVLSLLVLSLYYYQCCIIIGKWWLYNLHLGCINNSEFWY